jgi:hypothetical protein
MSAMTRSPENAPMPLETAAGETTERNRWGLDEGDLSLIRWMLKMNPTERLEFAQRFAAGVRVLQNARRA